MNKAGKTTITLSAVLILVLLTASIYIFIPDKVKLTVEDTKSSFFVWEDDSWVLGATEYVHLYDGTKKMRASARDVVYDTTGDITTITRLASWKDNISTIDTYIFDSTATDVTLFPISHTLEITNAVGKIVHFEYRDILYTGETRLANSPETFGHQMKIEWQEGNYYAKVFQQSSVADKLIIRYRPTSDYEVYNVRMFDPPEINLSFNAFEDVDVIVEDGSEINISAESTDGGATVCLSADISSLGDDFSCGTGSTYYMWNASSENNKIYGNFCYQESANVSDETGIDGDCSLLYTGDYNPVVSDWNKLPYTLGYDGNWGTYTGTNGIVDDGYIYINYTKPSFAEGAFWKVRDRDGIFDLLIPDACWNEHATTLNLRVRANKPITSGATNWYCDDGSWTVLRTSSTWSTVYIHEEAVTWFDIVDDDTVVFDAAPEAKNVTLEPVSDDSIVKNLTYTVVGNTSFYTSVSSTYVEHDEDSVRCTGTWDGTHSCALTYDEDYNTYGSPDTDNDLVTVYQNFTCSSCSGTRDATILQYKYFVAAGVTANKTLEDYDCNLDNVQVRFEVYESVGANDWFKIQCIDDTSPTVWNLVFLEQASDAYGWYRFYESSMYFNETVTTLDTDLDIPKNTKITFNDDVTQIVGLLGSDYNYIDFFGNGSSSVSTDHLGLNSVRYTNMTVTPGFDGYLATYNISGEAQDSLGFSSDGDYYNSGIFYYANGTVEKVQGGSNVGRPQDTNAFYRFGGKVYSSSYSRGATGQMNLSTKYDIDGGVGTITNLTDAPYDIGQQACAVYDSVNDAFIVLGGFDGTSTYYDKVYSYDIATDTWSSALTSMTHPLAYHTCTYNNGIVYVLGGFTTGDAITYWKELNAYNVSDNSWTNLDDTTYGRSSGNIETLNSTTLFTFAYSSKYSELYDIATDTWSTAGALPLTDPYWGMASFISEDGKYVYAWGGAGSLGYKSDVFKYDVVGDSWSLLGTISSLNIGTTTASNYYADAVVLDGVAYLYNSIYGFDEIFQKLYIYPFDVSITIGDLTTHTFSGSVASIEEESADFASTITAYAATCVKETDGSCLVPIEIQSYSPGTVILSDLSSIQTPNEITFGSSTITCATDYCNPTISFESEQNGTLNVSNVTLLFYGTDVINFTADDETYTTSNTVTNYYSDYDYDLPAGASGIQFYPWSVSLNTTPFGQTATTPVLDLTAVNIDGNSNLTFKYVIDEACINIYWGTDGVSYTAVVNDTWTDIYTDTADGGTEEFYLLGNYDCASSFTQSFSPDFYLRSCTSEADICDGDVS